MITPQLHELKTIPPYFIQVLNGKKTFELRYNDRNFKVHDVLYLKEYYPESDTYSGNNVLVRVLYVLKEFKGLEPGYCILGISKPI